MLRATTSRPRFLLFARLVLVLLFTSAPLEARPQTSLLRTDPPSGWEGFLMRTTVEAGFIPAGQDLHNAATTRVSTTNTNTAWVNPTATYPLNADVGVPTVTATRNPASGAAKDTATGTVDFDYLLQQDARDQWGFDITTTTSAVNAMVDFGSGPEPADSFVEVTLWMRSDGPYLVPDAWMELPALPALNDPATEQMLATAVLGQAYAPCAIRNTLIGYQQPSGPAVVAPFKLCPETPFAGGTFAPGYFEYNLDYSIVTPFGTDPTYSYSGTASAAVVSPLVVTNTNDAGPGSLRQAIADAVNGDFITFHPSLSGQTITLTSGPLRVMGKQLSIDASTLEDRITIDAGGASRVLSVDATGNAALYALRLENGNSFGHGGAVLSNGTLGLFDCEIRDSSASGATPRGGGIVNLGGALAMTRCIVSGNTTATGAGGGVASLGGTLNLDECEIHHNEAGQSGGGLYLTTHEGVAIRNSSFHHNTAEIGGGLFFGASSTHPVTIINSTIAENEAVSTGSGIYCVASYPVHTRHCTIVRNSADEGAAVVFLSSAEWVSFSSIISENTPTDVDATTGTLTSDGYNLVGTGPSAADFKSTGDQTGITDPQLSPLGKYGFMTSALIPLAGSPAVDAGNTDAQTLPTDQWGRTRLADGDRDGLTFVDIGSVEATTPTLVVTNGNDSGPGSLREVVAEVPDRGLVLFADFLRDGITHLSTGEIEIAGKELTIDGSSIQTIDPALFGRSRVALAYIVSAGDLSRHFSIASDATVTIRGLELRDGLAPAADPRGGAILNHGTLVVVNSKLHDNEAGPANNAESGALHHAGGHLTLVNCSFFYNSAHSGGALSRRGGTWSLQGCYFSTNTARSEGGAIRDHLFAAPFTATSCEFSFNFAAASGGGLYTVSPCAFFNCSFLGNRSPVGAGLLVNGPLPPGEEVRLEQCTLYGNTASTAGGGFYSIDADVSLRHCTVTLNKGRIGGGGFLAIGSTTVRCYSCILSGNRNRADADATANGSIVSLGYNLVGQSTPPGAFTATGDVTGIDDPELSALGLHGGLVPTAYPLSGSPALDRGATDAGSSTTDQRGEPRTVDGDGLGGAAPDIGAVESPGPTATIVVANTNDDGPGSLRQAIADAAVRGMRITFDPSLDGGTITIATPLLFRSRSLFVDAGDLPSGLTLDGAGASRLLEVDTLDSSLALRNIQLRNGFLTLGSGSAIHSRGSLTLLQCTVADNDSPDGSGAIDTLGPGMVIQGCTFTGNTSFREGGALNHHDNAVLSVSDSTFTNNSSQALGGALFIGAAYIGSGASSTAFLDRSLFTGNHSGRGGAVYFTAAAPGFHEISRCTLTGNSAIIDGGALGSVSGAELLIERSTIENNSAGGLGGAIWNSRGSVKCTSSTLTGNSASPGGGGGIFLTDSEGEVLSSIISGNTGSDIDADATGSFFSVGHNLVGFGNAVPDFNNSGDQTGINNPRLAPLANYGGSLPTMHPLPGSPVIDAGSLGGISNPPLVDQRGFARLFGPQVDIGAVEFAPLVLQTIPVTNLNDFGPGSLRKAVEDAGIGTLITIDPSLDGGVIPLSGPLSLQVPFVKIDASALPEGITLNGQNSTHLLEVATTAVVDLCAVTLEDGFSFDCGGGIINEGVLTLNECTVRNCVAQLKGGGICNQGGRLVVRNSSLVGNEAADPDQGRGGGVFNNAELTFNTATLEQCTLADNSAGELGGGIFNFLGRLDLRHSTVAYNTAPTDGAGVATFGDLSAETHVFSSIIGGNFGTDVAFVLDPSNQFFSGGYNLIGLGNAAGAFVKPGDFTNVANPSLAPLGNYGGRTLTILPRSNSLALEGGDLPSLTLEGDQRGLPRLIDLGHDGIVRPDIGAVEVGPFPFPNNTALVTTGTDFAPGSLRSILAPDIIPGTVITFAPGLDGDTIGFTGGEITVSGLFLKIDALALPNSLELNGGGSSRIFNVASQSDLELCGLTLREGASIGAPGGAIFNEGFLTVRQCSFESNEAGQGGAIANQFGQLTLLDSTFSNNLATDGGAIHHDGDLVDRIAIVDQCTFAENTAGNQGGALFNLMGIMNVRHTTISENDAFDTGSAIATNGDSSVETRLFSTIAAGNFGGTDLAIVLDPLDRYATDGGNVIGTTSGTSVFPGIEDQIGILDPGLSSLGDHGGRTRTMVVEFGSPAREAGGTDSGSRLTDQRGFVRTFGNGPDSGAYEASGNGGYFVWAREFIPPGNDRSFAGHGDDDRMGNGTEYGIDTDPGRADAASPNNPLLTEPSAQPSFTFGIRPEAFDVIWVVQRSTDLQTWTELYRYDGTTETIASDVTAVLDLAGRRITVTDVAPPTPRAFYRLAVLYNP